MQNASVPEETFVVAVLSKSNILQRQILKHLKNDAYDFLFCDKPEKLPQKCNVIFIDVSFFSDKTRESIRKLKEEFLKTPLIAIGPPAQETYHPPEKLRRLGVQEYFERVDIWQNAPYISERIIFYSQETPAQARKQARRQKRLQTKKPELILVGASTGGPEVLPTLLENMPADCPPVVLVQHIDHKFAESFYHKMCDASGLAASEVADGKIIEPGHLYMPTGEYHVGIRLSAGKLVLFTDTRKTGPHRPSIDFLFDSCSQIEVPLCAVLMTGLGADGSRSLAVLKKNGAFTMVQDKNSSAVFGMPEEAIKLGAAQFVGNPMQLRHQIIKLIS